MKKLLVKGRCDWADEFDCEFLGLFTEDNWNSIVKYTKEGFEKHDGEEVSVYFGSNEYIEIDSYKQWLSCFTVVEIPDSMYEKLLEVFPSPFGVGRQLFGVASRF